MKRNRKPKTNPPQIVYQNLQAEISTYDAPVAFQKGDTVNFHITPAGQMIVTAIFRAGKQIWPEAAPAGL